MKKRVKRENQGKVEISKNGYVYINLSSCKCSDILEMSNGDRIAVVKLDDLEELKYHFLKENRKRDIEQFGGEVEYHDWSGADGHIDGRMKPIIFEELATGRLLFFNAVKAFAAWNKWDYHCVTQYTKSQANGMYRGYRVVAKGDEVTEYLDRVDSFNGQ